MEWWREDANHVGARAESRSAKGQGRRASARGMAVRTVAAAARELLDILLELLLVLVLQLLLLVRQLHRVRAARLVEALLVPLALQPQLDFCTLGVGLLQVLSARRDTAHDPLAALERRALDAVPRGLVLGARGGGERLHHRAQRLSDVLVQRALALGQRCGGLGARIELCLLPLLDSATQRVDDAASVGRRMSVGRTLWGWARSLAGGLGLRLDGARGEGCERATDPPPALSEEAAHAVHSLRRLAATAGALLLLGLELEPTALGLVPVCLIVASDRRNHQNISTAVRRLLSVQCA